MLEPEDIFICAQDVNILVNEQTKACVAKLQYDSYGIM